MPDYSTAIKGLSLLTRTENK